MKISSLTWVLLAVFTAVVVWSCRPDDSGPGDPEIRDTTDARYAVYSMTIEVDGHAPVVSKDPADYLPCTVSLDGMDKFDDFEGRAKIRGRGNSSWLWYDKKPYRIKLDATGALLGMKGNRDWVLLANYRDPTDLMNAFGFETAHYLGLPFTNSSRYVEVTLNGDYIGLYQLTEQVEQGHNRVDIQPEGGLLICLDLDDGPELSPDATDNFRSSVFDLPVCIKYPEDPTSAQITEVRNDFGMLETAIREYDYLRVSDLLDIPSFINYLILEEFVYNVEIDAPRSVFMHKDAGGKYVMGPAWDFDAGFDFDWGTMTTGHNYFNQQELVMGTDPANHTGGYRISDFFTLLFRNAQFVTAYKNRWKEIRDSIFAHSWKVMEKYKATLQPALARDAQRWPIDRNYVTETARMEDWLSKRVAKLDAVISAYPGGTNPTVKIDKGTWVCTDTLSYMLGYNQAVTVDIPEDTVLARLDITHEQLYSSDLRIVPLKTDGSEGMNNTNGLFGGWFEADNNPGYWAYGHVYIEVMEDLTRWNCGLRAEEGFCAAGDTHAVRMQYQYNTGEETRTVTVIVTFIIVE